MTINLYYLAIRVLQFLCDFGSARPQGPAVLLVFEKRGSFQISNLKVLKFIFGQFLLSLIA